VLPNPVNALGGLVTKITTVKVPAKEKNISNLSPVGGPQLPDFGCLLLAANLLWAKHRLYLTQKHGTVDGRTGMGTLTAPL